MVLHVPRPHAPHPDVDPHFDEHPWRTLPALLVASFAIAKAFTGHAY